ncbi:MAG: hypothetical protein AAGI07_08935 [Bacteroidota bacterium]
MLGWSPGTDQELFNMDELIKAFSIEKVSKSGAKFDFEKAKWFNQQYIKNYSIEKLTEIYLEVLNKEGITCSFEKAQKITSLMQERVFFPSEIYTNAKYFFKAPEAYDQKVAKKKWNTEMVEVLKVYAEAIQKLHSFDESIAKEKLLEILEKQEMGLGKVMPPLRLAVTGVGGGPDLMPLLVVLGKDEVADRLIKAIEDLAEYLR